MRPGALLLFVNGHGFGHATRCIAVLNELWRARPDLPVRIRTSAPEFLFRRACRGPFLLDAGDVDPGTIQRDALHLDVGASVGERVAFHDAMDRLVAREIERLEGAPVALCAGDIPPLAFEVAAALGVDSVALANFSWDWIYEAFVDRHPETARSVEAMRASYAKAGLLLRLPLHGPMSAFPVVEDIPHVVRPATSSREEVRRELGVADETRPLILVSFGGFAGLDFVASARPDPGPFRFITFGDPVPGLPGDAVSLPVNHGFRHEDLVAASDAVITKPGYGTVVECLASRTPVLYTDRDHFREYDVLVEGLRNGARSRHLPRADLLAVRWRAHLEALLADRRPWPEVRIDGASVAAGRIRERLERGWQGH